MADPFLAAGNIGVKPHMCRFAIVLELEYQHVSKVGDLCYFLKVSLLGFLEGDVGAHCNWKLVQHSSPLGCHCSLQALAEQIVQSLRMICGCGI
eukprot:10993888-Ditylum_brightwellii.AAC.1